MNLPTFEGKKWRRPDEFKEKIDIFGNITEVPIFRMSEQYKNYLTEREQLKKQQELLVLKNKLDYQMSTYGEVDEVDYNLYIHLLTASMNTTSKPTSKPSKISRQVVVTRQQ